MTEQTPAPKKIVRKQPMMRRWTWGVIALTAFFLIAWQLGSVAILLLLSFLVAYFLNPLVTRLASIQKMGRTTATVITMVGLAVGFVAILFLIVPQILSEMKYFVEQLPSLAEKLHQMVDARLRQYTGTGLPEDWNKIFDSAYARLKQDGDKLVAPIAEFTRFAFGKTFTFLFVLVSMLMFPLFLFFVLRNFPQIIRYVDELIPLKNKSEVRRLTRDVDLSLSAYLHGQFTVMLVLGALYSVGYVAVGIPLGLGVGLLTGVLCFIPYLGAATGFVLACLMAVLSFGGLTPVLAVIAVFSVVQLLDAAFITPRILGGSLGLDPLWIIVALMAGGEVFGFLGVLLAIPATAVLKVLIGYSVQQYKHSELYLDETASRK